jgi:hypothetical protein
MAKAARGAKVPPSSDHAASDTPAPSDNLQFTFISLSEGTLLHRVHQDKYQATQFNPGVAGNARFSPIADEHGKPIPTLYGGMTMVCALMETVFHDVPHTAGFKSFDKGKLASQSHSTIRVERALQLVDLASVALRKMGVTRKQLIDTEKEGYPATRRWAAAIHQQCPQAQGLSWISRQDDSTRAVMLFGDRIPAGSFQQVGMSRSLLYDGDAYDAVLDLADRIGLMIVLAKR